MIPILCLLLGQIGGGQEIDHEAVGRLVEAGAKALQAGNLLQARIELEKAVHQEPENAEANLQLGLLLGQLGNVQGASESFRRAAREKPDWPEAHYNLGLTMVADPAGKRDWPGAILEFREALRLRLAYPAARHLLGVGLSELGQREASIVELRAALETNANSPETHLDLGKALEGAEDEAGAEREYRESVRLRPGYVDGELALGKLLMKNTARGPGGGLEAIEHFKRALRSNPDNAGAQYALAKAFQRAGQSDEAAIAFREAAALTKREEDAVQCTRLSNAGLDAAHKDQGDAAIKLLREAVELRPDAAIAHYNLGLVLADRGDTAAGQAQVVQAISLMPVDALYYVALGRMSRRLENLQSSRAAFERAVELDAGNQEAAANLRDLAKSSLPQHADEDQFLLGAASDTPDAHFAFATFLARKGDWMGSVGEWLRVLALQPGNLDARNNLGVSYSKLQKDDLAELEFRKALQVSSDSAGAHFGLAVLHLEHGSKPEALRELQEVLRIQPDYPEAKNLLSMASK